MFNKIKNVLSGRPIRKVVFIATEVSGYRDSANKSMKWKLEYNNSSREIFPRAGMRLHILETKKRDADIHYKAKVIDRGNPVATITLRVDSIDGYDKNELSPAYMTNVMLSVDRVLAA